MRNFSILIILIVSGSVLFLSCITKRGTKVDASSIGKTIEPSNLVKQPSGVYKIKQTKTPIPPGIPYNPSKNEVTVTPIAPKSAATKPEIVEPEPKKKELPRANPLVNVLPPQPTNEIILETSPPTLSGNEGEKKEETMKIHWYELWTFYAGAIVVLLICWLLYGIIRDGTKLSGRKKDTPAKKAPKKRKTKKKSPKIKN